jgi:hypothetical protein
MAIWKSQAQPLHIPMHLEMEKAFSRQGKGENA